MTINPHNANRDAADTFCSTCGVPEPLSWQGVGDCPASPDGDHIFASVASPAPAPGRDDKDAGDRPVSLLRCGHWQLQQPQVVATLDPEELCSWCGQSSAVIDVRWPAARVPPGPLPNIVGQFRHGIVCENHPEKSWPDECSCGAGEPRRAPEATLPAATPGRDELREQIARRLAAADNDDAFDHADDPERWEVDAADRDYWYALADAALPVVDTGVAAHTEQGAEDEQVAALAAQLKARHLPAEAGVDGLVRHIENNLKMAWHLERDSREILTAKLAAANAAAARVRALCDRWTADKAGWRALAGSLLRAALDPPAEDDASRSQTDTRRTQPPQHE